MDFGQSHFVQTSSSVATAKRSGMWISVKRKCWVQTAERRGHVDKLRKLLLQMAKDEAPVNLSSVPNLLLEILHANIDCYRESFISFCIGFRSPIAPVLHITIKKFVDVVVDGGPKYYRPPPKHTRLKHDGFELIIGPIRVTSPDEHVSERCKVLGVSFTMVLHSSRIAKVSEKIASLRDILV